MSESVIVQLKSVDIKHTNGKRQFKAYGFPPACSAFALISAPVCHAGELVDHGLLFKLHLVMIELDMRIYPCPDNRRIKRLCDIIHRAKHQPPFLILRIGQAGNEDYRHIPGKFHVFQLLEKHKAVHLRHDHIQQNQGISPFYHSLQSFLRRMANRYPVILLQDRTQKFTLYRTVVNHQYSIHEISLISFL